MLRWAKTTAVAWGYNAFGQLGDSGTTNPSMPVDVVSTGILADRILVSVAAGDVHSLALCSDGTVAAWGGNS